jgi:4-hydroxythreonine-4-phosphate dehydrogenase
VIDALPLHIGARAFKPFGRASAGEAEFVDLGIVRGPLRFGTTDASTGAASYRYLIEALKLVFSGGVSALVTCPITKKSIQAAGIPFMGHTELLAHYGGVTDYVMMVMNRRLKVSLVTIHVPLRDVPRLAQPEAIFRCIAVTARALEGDFAIPSPRIKVCGLNPHAGEQGLIGTEDAAVAEAVERARSSAIRAEGPYPADSLFHGGIATPMSRSTTTRASYRSRPPISAGPST